MASQHWRNRRGAGFPGGARAGPFGPLVTHIRVNVTMFKLVAQPRDLYVGHCASFLMT